MPLLYLMINIPAYPNVWKVFRCVFFIFVGVYFDVQRDFRAAYEELSDLRPIFIVLLLPGPVFSLSLSSSLFSKFTHLCGRLTHAPVTIWSRLSLSVTFMSPGERPSHIHRGRVLKPYNTPQIPSPSLMRSSLPFHCQ